MVDYYSSLRKKEKKKARNRRLVFWLLTLLLLGGGTLAFLGYRAIYSSNIWLNGQKEVSIIIPTGSDWSDVKQILYKNGTIVHRETFEWLAQYMKYPGHIKPGHYLLKDGMNNRQLITKLRAGKQDPVKLIFNNIRTKEDLAGRIGGQLEPDSLKLITMLNDTAVIGKWGFTPFTILTMFIPNTYEVYWNITADKFLERMHKEYNSFWNENRQKKLTETGLTRLQAMTMASIVEKETNMNAEKPDIAGVYMNRLKQGWLLQADPTLVFALGDFTIKRVLNVYKKINSPYNTYLYIGLPPGPICMPSISSIDAVLNYSHHNY
ncbi:MAG TPA: endolytic transglycosylase MltG, partial [Bacteroidales bacterium]|nr:endolytic transglycosylase MltG [Bacteroidales bacterium]